MLKPGELDPKEVTSNLMGYGIMMDSFGILEAAHKRVRRQGGQVTGPSLEEALRHVCLSGIILRKYSLLTASQYKPNISLVNVILVHKYTWHYPCKTETLTFEEEIDDT